MACSSSVSPGIGSHSASASQDLPAISSELSKVSISNNSHIPQCCGTDVDMKGLNPKCSARIHVLTETDASRRMNIASGRAGLQQERIEKDASPVQFKKDPKELSAIDPYDLKKGEIASTGSIWASAEGRRYSMEDAHLGTSFTFKAGEQSVKTNATGVFDGFGGSKVSNAIEKHIESILIKNLELFNKPGLSDKGIFNALRQTMEDLEKVAKEKPELARAFHESGSTLNLALQIGQQMYIANVGDARAGILTIKDGKAHIQQLTEDQKVSSDLAAGRKELRERGYYEDGLKHEGNPTGYFESRVKKGNGNYNDYQGRVYGPSRSVGIMVNRAIGSFESGSALTCLPKVTKFQLDPEAKQILFQGCDGLYDVATTEDYGQLLSELQNHSKALEDEGVSLPEAFVKNAFTLGSGDNLTSIITPIKVSKDDIIIESNAEGIKQAKDYIDEIKAEQRYHFHGDMSRQQAEDFLRYNPDMPFVTRPSSIAPYQALTYKNKDGGFENYIISLPTKPDLDITIYTSSRPSIFNSVTRSYEGILRLIETGH